MIIFILSCCRYPQSCYDPRCVAQKDWSIKTGEEADIYFPRYLDFANNVLDRHNIEYIYEDNFKNHSDYSRRFLFNENFCLEISLFYDMYNMRNDNWSNYSLAIEYYCENTKKVTKEQIESFPREFFNVLQEIDCFYANVQGDNAQTYNNLFDEFLRINDFENPAYNANQEPYYISAEEHLECKVLTRVRPSYRVSICARFHPITNKINKCFTVTHTAFLSDKNVKK